MPFTTVPSAGAKLRASILADVIGEVRPLAAYKASDLARSSTTTATADTELLVSADASTVYGLDGFLIWTSGTTPDFKLTLTLPASATMRVTAETWSRAAAAGSQLVDSRTMIQGETLAIPGQGTTFSTQSQWTKLTGVVTISTTAGTVSVDWAQNTSDAGSTTLYAGSWLKLKQF